jgi:hypothetical protein
MHLHPMTRITSLDLGRHPRSLLFDGETIRHHPHYLIPSFLVMWFKADKEGPLTSEISPPSSKRRRAGAIFQRHIDPCCLPFAHCVPRNIGTVAKKEPFASCMLMMRRGKHLTAQTTRRVLGDSRWLGMVFYKHCFSIEYEMHCSSCKITLRSYYVRV